MGGSNQAIKVVVIDELEKQEDFQPIKNDKRFNCHYERSFSSFLENQNMKDLPYLIIREKAELDQFKDQKEQIKDKIKQSSIVAKTFSNLLQLDKQFQGKRIRSHHLIRNQIISLVRKYDMQQLVIYLLVDKAFDFKIPQSEQPYIHLVAEDINIIKSSILSKPQGQESMNFKFRRMVKDLYRRTAVKILNTEQNKDQSKKMKKEWVHFLGKKITSSFTDFNQDDFKSGLISNYYDFIVVSNSSTFAFVQDMKKIHKFESEIIYHGDIRAYGREEYHQQTDDKIQQIKQCLWMHDESIETIAKAIKNCCDIVAEETSIVAENVIIYTHISYGQIHNDFIQEKLRNYLLKPTAQLQKRKSKDITEKGWVERMKIKVVSNMTQLKEQFKRRTFSYLLTFDCDINEIQNVKSYLLQEKFDTRVYMYNAEEKQDKIEQIYSNIHKDEVVRKYLDQRVKEVIKKAGFRIKFETGPVDEITTYKIKEKEVNKFTSEMGLMTTIIPNRQDFQQNYMASNREKIINGMILVIKAEDYFEQYKKLLEKDIQMHKDSYLANVKVIMMDKEKPLKQNWNKIKEEVRAERIHFVHYNFSKIRDFIEVMVTPRLNLTIFIKKSLPNFYKAHQKISENKFKIFELTGSIVSKNKILKEVFGDQNFKLTKQYHISFLKLPNSNKNLDEALTVLHEQFLYRYGIMWRTGFPIITRDVTKPIFLQAMKDSIKRCLYRCKSYFLIDVTEEEFNYFYISKVDQCSTYLELQVTAIYIYSLPHGLASVIQRIFQDPLTTILAAKFFSGFILTLLAAFCSFEDEVMNKENLLVYINDSNFKEFRSIMGALKIGDILFNRSLLMCGKSNENAKSSNISNNCLFIEFENIPMLSKTHIKNYLNIQRFAFYKEGCDYLIAPYTEFIVKNIHNTIEGKVHVTLSATNDSQKGLVAKTLASNHVNEQEFHEVIKEEVELLKSTIEEAETKRIRQTESLYKKAEMVGILKQKLELIKAIQEGFEYNNFLKAIRNKKYMTALCHIKKKEQAEKSTTQIQAAYFKNMLGVEKALLYYSICEYEMAMREIDRVIEYIQEQNVDEGQNWVIKKLKQYKQNVRDLNTKRQKYSNHSQKIKYWKISGVHSEEEDQKVQVQTKMEQKSMTWNVKYEPEMEQFYIQEEGIGKQKLFHYNILPAFGELTSSFPPGSSYQTIEQRKAVEKQQVLEKKKLEKIHHSPTLIRRQSSQMDSPNKIKLNRTESKINQDQEAEELPQTPVLNLIGKQESFSLGMFEEVQQVRSPGKLLKIQSVIHERQEERQEEIAFKPSKILNQPPTHDYNNFVNGSHLSSEIYTENEVLMGVKETINWQAFFFNGKVVLTQKGKHYKAHMPNKHNF